jgi:hypothetical protein
MLFLFDFFKSFFLWSECFFYRFGQELDVKYSSGEGLRQMNKAITRLNFQKHSKIQNYNNADNEILQNQKHSLETFSQFKLHKFNESQKFKQPKFKPNSYLS